jgi:Bacterial SH3 domain
VPYHFNAFFGSSLAAAMFLCLNLARGEASECVGKPDRSVNQAGHWHSRVHHRRSQSPQNTVADNSIVVATVRSDVVLRAGPGAEFRAIGHVPRGTELETTDCIGGWYQVEFNGIAGFVGAADPGNDTAIGRPSARRAEDRKLTPPKYLRTNKIVSRERLQTQPPPATNSVADAERHDQLPGNGEKNEKPAPQLTDSGRQALFDDFLKWYLTVRLKP